MNRYLGTALLSLALLNGCGKAPEKLQADQKEKEIAQIAQFISQHGYGIMPQTRTDEMVIGLYNIPEVSIISMEGDTLSDLATVLYRDSSEWEIFKIKNPSLKKFDADDPLPSGLNIITNMLSYQLQTYRRDFPDRSVFLKQ